MNIKSLLLGSVTALLAVSRAYAIDPVIITEPEPVEYVRVCDAYGAGYFYIPGTETCMRISGYIQTEIKGGNNAESKQYAHRNRDTYSWRTRIGLRSHTASDTDLGTLRTFIELRSQWDSGAEFGGANDTASGQLRFAYIELGGLRVGLDETIFKHWTGDFGSVINDDILSPLAEESRTNVISYTFSNDNGFAFIIGLEQGNNDGNDMGYRIDRIGNLKPRKLSQQIDGYTPNILVGTKFVQGWGSLSAIAAYDAYYSEWAGKMRLDINLTDQFSLWAMGGYKSMEDYYNIDETYGIKGVRTVHPGYNRLGIYRMTNSLYGDWGGAWAVWGGGSYKFTPQTSFNFQVAYEEAGTFASSVNLSHELVPGFTVTPEVTYISWNNKYGRSYTDPDLGTVNVRNSLRGKDAVQGIVRFQRAF